MFVRMGILVPCVSLAIIRITVLVFVNLASLHAILAQDKIMVIAKVVKLEITLIKQKEYVIRSVHPVCLVIQSRINARAVFKDASPVIMLHRMVVYSAMMVIILNKDIVIKYASPINTMTE
jgi:hypothetical protein